jgi:uncharacterized protein (DUF885 family)
MLREIAIIVFASISMPLAAFARGQPLPSPDATATSLADAYVTLRASFDPTTALSAGIPIQDNRSLPDRSAAAFRKYDTAVDDLWHRLESIRPKRLQASDQYTTYVILKEALDAERSMRVCKQPLWAVNHFTGWQVSLTQIASIQPVGTAELRAQAQRRLLSLPPFVETEIANLRDGVAHGYTAPRTVVQRVLVQLDHLADATSEQSPFYSPAERDTDPEFQVSMRAIVGGPVRAAIRRYRDYLRDEYITQARNSLSVSSLPGGAACYRAYLRMYTTLNRPPLDVFITGQRAVAANETIVRDVGARVYGSRNLVEIVRRTNSASDNHFSSTEELLGFSADVLSRARRMVEPYFSRLPKEAVKLELAPLYQSGSGMSAHYEPSPGADGTGTYFVPRDSFLAETRGSAEITVAHETYPGHHLQLALAAEMQTTSPLRALVANSAYVEGWARYAEGLAEEAGIYQTDYARISRRVWAARGMVVDPGIHALGWTRAQAVAYIASSGRFDQQGAEDLVDRIAALPGQLTAYDSGGLEIAALRRQAEKTLDSRFDIRLFHQKVLEQGVVPLSELRRHVGAWIASH